MSMSNTVPSEAHVFSGYWRLSPWRKMGGGCDHPTPRGTVYLERI